MGLNVSAHKPRPPMGSGRANASPFSRPNLLVPVHPGHEAWLPFGATPTLSPNGQGSLRRLQGRAMPRLGCRGRWVRGRLEGNTEAGSRLTPPGRPVMPSLLGLSFLLLHRPPTKPEPLHARPQEGTPSPEGPGLSAFSLGEAEKEKTWGQPSGSFYYRPAN